MNRSYFLIVPVIGLLLLFLGFFIKIPLSQNLFIQAGPNVYPVSNLIMIKQEFIPQRQVLLGFRLAFKKTNDVDHPVKIELGKVIDEYRDRVLYEGRFSSRAIGRNKPYNFWLSKPLLKEPGEKYNLSFFAPVSSSSASISPLVSLVDNYLEGNTFLFKQPFKKNKQSLPGDVQFEPIYSVLGYRAFTYFINRIAFKKPFLYNKYTITLLAFFSLLILFTLIFLLAKNCYLKSAQQFKKFIALFIAIVLLLAILFYQKSPEFYLQKVV